MLATVLAPTVSCTDPFLKPQDQINAAGRAFRRARPEPLQRVIDAIGNILLSQNISTMARFEGAKVMHLLQTQGAVRDLGRALRPAPLREECSRALQELASTSADGQVIACAIAALLDDLDWYRGKTGPYASTNFEHGHAHAMLVGPGGIEERPDLRVGVTVMAPYTRFPDHEQTNSRVVMAFSEGEFQSDAGDWHAEKIGSSIFSPAGQQFAMRCTTRPLLTLWCQRLRA